MFWVMKVKNNTNSMENRGSTGTSKENMMIKLYV